MWERQLREVAAAFPDVDFALVGDGASPGHIARALAGCDVVVLGKFSDHKVAQAIKAFGVRRIRHVGGMGGIGKMRRLVAEEVLRT